MKQMWNLVRVGAVRLKAGVDHILAVFPSEVQIYLPSPCIEFLAIVEMWI